MTHEPTASLEILLAESNPDDASLFERRLLETASQGPPPKLVRARSAAEARERVVAQGFDLIVLDAQLADGDGLELARELRSAGVEAPLLMLTGREGEETAVAASCAGATDYLSKSGLSAEALRRSMRYALELARQARLRRSAEASLALRERQLRETQRLETVATLSAGVAHEFNNLLNVVVGYGDMMRRRLPPGDPLHRHVEHILQAAEKATALTRQLTAFSHGQALQPSVLDPAALLGDLAPVVRSVVGRRIEVAVRADPGVGYIKADRSQINHALMSLIVNAKEAMPEGGQLTLEAAGIEIDDAEAAAHGPGLRPGRYVMLAVSDTGAGMPAEVRARASEPFFTTKGRASATGLGLSTVHGIVSQGGGQVRINSEPGQGCAVRIYLPQVDAGGRPVQPAAPGG